MLESFCNYFLVILFDAFLLSFLSSDDNSKSAKKSTKKNYAATFCFIFLEFTP
jgi:hypothetical protein